MANSPIMFGDTGSWAPLGTGGSSATVGARAYITASHFSDPANPMNFDTVDFDTNSNITTGSSWKFTASVKGIYQLQTTIITAASAISFAVYKNGTLINRPFIFSPNNTTYQGGATLVSLDIGDYMDTRADVAGITVAEGAINIFLAKPL